MKKIKKIPRDEAYHHQRGWGWEVWIENMPEYCGKILHIKKGKKGSLHFHRDKLETMMLSFGLIELVLIDPETGVEYKEILNVPGDSIKIPRGQVHQICALDESEIIEFSTEHKESDSFRVRKGD